MRSVLIGVCCGVFVLFIDVCVRQENMKGGGGALKQMELIQKGSSRKLFDYTWL